MRNLGSRVKTRWAALFCLIVALLMALGSMTAAAAPGGDVGPQEVQVTEGDAGQSIDLNGEVLVLNLKSNPSTGYSWHARGLDQRILRQLDATEWIPDVPGKLGGPGVQVLRFAAVSRGQVRLTLVYARPWEGDVAPAQSFSLQVSASERSRNVTYPEPAAEEPAATAAGEAAALALPAALNWCDQGGCTPVRNQGQCGSCWAFGTVGPLESAILIQDKASKDLSEQWLVSCNTDGWGCDGGWWAHDYHVSPGSVYESAFPYTATDAPCGGPYTYQEKIADWVYIGSPSGVPSTDAIKQAIVDHGPVSAAVCVNTAFQSYKSGVFNPTTSCQTINHAIVLVGWDDSLGAWRLRNSWGSSWGESGYMWIAYGKNQVGYSANYVVYNGSAPVTPPAAPTGLTASAVSSSQINLAWTDNATNETGFKIERCTGPGCTNFAQIATVGVGVTSYANTGLAASTSYSYRVRATNTGGDSAYSNTATAVTQAPPAIPAAPTGLTARAVSSSQINLAWTDNAGNETGFYIERCKGATCTKFAQIATVGANVTAFSNTKLVANTTYRYRVRAYNASGASAYSNIAQATTLAR